MAARLSARDLLNLSASGGRPLRAVEHIAIPAGAWNLVCRRQDAVA